MGPFAGARFDELYAGMIAETIVEAREVFLRTLDCLIRVLILRLEREARADFTKVYRDDDAMAWYFAGSLGALRDDRLRLFLRS